MKKFEIQVTEKLSRNIKIEAISEIEAIEEITKRYNNQDIVLDYNDFKELMIYRKGDDLKSLLEVVIEYLFEDEKRNFEEEDELSENHIYLILVKIKKLLDNNFI